MIDLERAVPDLERLPRRAGPDGRAIRCTAQRGGRRCDHILAVIENGLIFIRDGGSEHVSHLPAEIRCERCGHWTRLA